MAYATFQDVQNRWAEDLTDSETVIDTRLGDAELIIKTRIPDLNAQVTAGTIDQDMVVLVESEMILRIIRNPEGYMQESDGGYSYMLNQAISSGDLDVLPREWKYLGLSGGAFVIRPMIYNSLANTTSDPNAGF